jgi:hypothetical protein
MTDSQRLLISLLLSGYSSLLMLMVTFCQLAVALRVAVVRH